MKKTRLFDLIKSLDSNEKRYISRKLRKHKAQFELYKVIVQSKSPTLSKDHSASFKNIEILKFRLYHQTLYLLEQYHDNEMKSLDLHLLNQLPILFRKGLYTHCVDLINKGIDHCRQSEKFDTLLNLINWKKRLINIEHKGAETLGILENIRGEELRIHNKQSNYSEYNHLYVKLLHSLQDKGIPQDLQAKKIISNFLNHPLLRSEEQAKSIKSKIVYHSILRRFFHLIEFNLLKALQHSKMALDLVQIHGENIIEPNYIQHIYGNHLLLISQSTNEKLFQEAIDLISGSRFISKQKDIQLQLALLSARINFNFQTGKTKENKSIVGELRSFRITNKKQLSNPWHIVLYFFEAYHFYSIGDFNQSLVVINEALSQFRFTGRNDVIADLKILQLVMHFDLENYIIIGSLIRSTYRYLMQKEIIIPFQKVLLNFLRKEASTIQSLKEFKQKAKSLKKDLSNSLSDEYDQRNVSRNIDLISWLDSKIENKPVAEVFIRNAKKRLNTNNFLEESPKI